jgi:hypothetical protein
MNRLVFAIAVVLVGSCWCQDAEAFQRGRVSFSGTADDPVEGLNQLTQDVTFAGGDSVSGSFTYNVGTAPDIVDGTTARFVVAEPASYELSINGLTYRSIGDFGLSVTNDSVLDRFEISDGVFGLQTENNLTGHQVSIDGTAIDALLSMSFTDATAAAFDSLALPDSSFKSSDFSLNNGTIVGDNPDGSGFWLMYQIDSFEIQTILLADTNLDGVVDFFDITPFISLLSSGEFQVEADVNEDGAVSFLDISPFIVLLGIGSN